ncbi:hypothetical protein NQ317_000067 [Molorchus minor]|uniref:CCHC-type domain-containing protein n=1 Tax=Molorchus minor TaxID=1323400 RepID=A0ABQ9JJZ9_9CUCU|nr:hypothetical protein NQ317_000067 [Molorchus minor]
MSSNYDMDPMHLRTHELNHELRIRNVATDRVDVTLKRKYLRRELKKDQSRPEIRYATPHFDFDLEKGELEDSISSVTGLINDYDGVNKELGNRIKSRLNHILGRLARLPEDDSEEVANYRGDNTVIVSVLEEDLMEIIENHQRGQEIGHAQERRNSNATETTSKSISVYKWAIKFNAGSARNSLHSFLQRVEELRIARRCSKQELFEAASDLFEGYALEWYRAQLRRDRFDSWDSLVTALKKDFLPVEYDDELWKQIEKRTQQMDEPVIIYISIMENLFDCLSEKPTEKQKLRILKTRVLPQYRSHIALQEINSITNLIETCRLLEDSEVSKTAYQPPSRKNVSMLESGLTYPTPFSEASGSGDGNRRSARPENQSGTSGTIPRPLHRTGTRQPAEVRCWKCKTTGHMQRDCPDNQKRIPTCYGCGRRNVIRPNCPSCSKNGRREGDI